MRTLALLSMSLLALPGALGAAEFYVGAGVGDKVEAGPYSEPLAQFGVEAEDSSMRALVGVVLSQRFAVEGSYYDFGPRKCCPQLADAGFETELDGFSVALVGRKEFDRLQLFAKAGMLFWQEDGHEISIAGPVPVSADGSDPILGAGLWWRVVGGLSLGAEWEVFELSGDSADTLWLMARIGL